MNYPSPKSFTNSNFDSNTPFYSENFEFSRDNDESENLLRNDSNTNNEFERQIRIESNKPTNFSSNNEGGFLKGDIFNDFLSKNNLFEINNLENYIHKEIINENNNDNDLSLLQSFAIEEKKENKTHLKRKRNNNITKFKNDIIR